MKYSYKWLKELSGVNFSAKEIAELLMLHAFEVDGIEEGLNEGLENVLVGEVLEVERHPDADKLKLVKVDIGKEVLDIVCGAPNVGKGQKVAVAKIGAKFPNGMEIKEVEIRGQNSSGMICAEDELGLGDSHEGIMVLDNNIEKGTSIIEALDLNDSVIDVDVLANRGHDALSHVGMAREIAALSGTKLNYDYKGLSVERESKENLEVSIKNNEICSRYIGVVMDSVQVKESPQWLKNRLEKSGIRPINNIVDVTNYVMLELGQPMHAFDFEKIDKKILVRKARGKEEIELLDGAKKELSSDDIVIADNEKALALAGIMGGKYSSVNNETSKVVLEAANFNQANIRRTRMRLGVITDSALRFEKGLDPNLAEKAMARAIELLEDTAGAKFIGMTDVYPNKLKNWEINLELENISKLLGEEIEQKKCISILKSLDMNVEVSGGKLQVEIPTYRLDLQNQEDLIEEIGRIYGYDKIKPQPFLAEIGTPKENSSEKTIRKIREKLSCKGFTEAYNYSFYGQKDMELMALEDIEHLEIENPISQNLKYLRQSLVPGIIGNISQNLKIFEDIKIFEIGNVYFKAKDLIEEKTKVTGAIIEKPNKVKEKDKRNESVYYELKSYLESFLSDFSISDLSYEKINMEDKLFWHPHRTANILSGEDVIGKIGEINPLILEEVDIQKRVAIFEIDLNKVIEKMGYKVNYKQLNKFPSVERDISLLVDSTSDVTVGSIIEEIYEKGEGLVANVELFDSITYSEKENSFAFHLKFSSENRTLESEEVDRLLEIILSSLEKNFSAKIRK